jgi:hypothetical protein
MADSRQTADVSVGQEAPAQARTAAKARLREQALKEHLSLPLEERLRRAVALIIPRQTNRVDDGGR